MPLYRRLPEVLDEFDVIIAGGGTAGCIVASRLSSASPSLRILVIEGGPNNYQDPSIIHLALFFGALAPTSKHTVFHQAKPSEHLNGRAAVVPVGGTLGGGSSINFGKYSRAQRCDFDAWGVEGWATEDMIPYMKKLETYHGKGDEGVHGYDGPVHVSDGGWRSLPAQENFLEGARRIGLPTVDDIQNFDIVNAAAKAKRYVSPEGLRQDTAHTYLHPRLGDGQHPNLHVVVESQVVKVIVEDGNATGVVFRANPKFQNGDATERTVRATKMVVVSCGALGTPPVLQRSGIGPKGVLAAAKVPLVVESNGVGKGYEDHGLTSFAYKTTLDIEDTLNRHLFGLSPETPDELIANKDPKLGCNAQDASAKLRPTSEEVEALGPDFKDAWDEHFKDEPNKALVQVTLVLGIPGAPPEGAPPAGYLGMTSFTLYPYARGHVNITGPGIDDPIDFDTGFLADPKGIDLKKQVWAYKKQRELARRMPCFRGEVVGWHPPFPAESAAAAVTLDKQLPDDVEDIKYSAEDDKVIENDIRNKAGTTWHSMGTCKMMPRERGGVVDASLSVYGVEHLKIADLSITPGNIGANTANTAMAIAEKAADIFIRELGLA